MLCFWLMRDVYSMLWGFIVLAFSFFIYQCGLRSVQQLVLYPLDLRPWFDVHHIIMCALIDWPVLWFGSDCVPVLKWNFQICSIWCEGCAKGLCPEFPRSLRDVVLVSLCVCCCLLWLFDVFLKIGVEIHSSCIYFIWECCHVQPYSAYV